MVQYIIILIRKWQIIREIRNIMNITDFSYSSVCSKHTELKYRLALFSIMREIGKPDPLEGNAQRAYKLLGMYLELF
jgi:hypothetical protein